jgi:hypothetical protein
MVISRYLTRGFRGNQVHRQVHVFVHEGHEPRDLRAPKRHLTATMYDSLSRAQQRRPGAGYQVLVACDNEALSAHVEAEHGARAEVVPIATAKHMAELLGVGLAVLDGAHCDVATAELWWELYHFVPRADARDALARSILL